MSSSVSPGADLGRSEIKTHRGAGVRAEVCPPDEALDHTVSIKTLSTALAYNLRQLPRFLEGEPHK